MKKLSLTLAVFAACLYAYAAVAQTNEVPFDYVWGQAVHVLPGTHNNESGYFSLCEGLDGSVYVGTAEYGVNSYLVEFDPRTESQRIVIDTHDVCGLTATGYAAQAKIHTRNFVGPSGKIYVASKQGYRQDGDTQEYPGGYVMTYDPRTGQAASQGMPYPGQGVIDVVADEDRSLLYVVTCEDQHWMVGDMKTGAYRELGPMLVSYATTLIDRQGRANAITHDFQLARYDPDTGSVTLHDIIIGERKFAKPEAPGYAIPCWNLARDGRTAWLNMINFPELVEIDLLSDGDTVQAVSHGPMIEGLRPDSRSSLCIGADSNVYAAVRIDNDTGFGAGYLHHIVRYNTGTDTMQDLGVLAVRNPDFFDFSPGPDGKGPPWSHGFHTLPDGTLTPLHSHQAMIATADNTLYLTILYPFTLLRIDDFRLTQPRTPDLASRTYLDFVLQACDRIETNMPYITEIAELAAERHLNGGIIGFPYNYQGLQGELSGRSGGPVHISFGRPHTKNRTPDEKALDIVLIGWQREPFKSDLDRLRQYDADGHYIMGFGPGARPDLAEHRALCDAWFDTGFGLDDRVVTLPDGSKAGRANLLVDILNAWCFIGEYVAALTRHGKMPTMWMSYCYEEGPAWGQKYLGKKQFHDDYHVPPLSAGAVGGGYLDRIRYHVRRFERTQLPAVERTAQTICDEFARGRKTTLASMGHMAWTFVGHYEDREWGVNADLHSNVKHQVDKYLESTPDEALVLRLGYAGMEGRAWEVFQDKKQRVMLISAENTRAGEHSAFLGSTYLGVPDGILTYIDMGYAYGDACVAIEGYPIRILPPSGVMQIVAYESVNCAVLSKLHAVD